MAAPGQTVQCPRCGSAQLDSGQHGYGAGKGAAGWLLLGPVGLLGGFFGSKRVIVTCLACGQKWEAGRQADAARQIALERERQKNAPFAAGLALVLIALMIGVCVLVAHDNRGTAPTAPARAVAPPGISNEEPAGGAPPPRTESPASRSSRRPARAAPNTRTSGGTHVCYRLDGAPQRVPAAVTCSSLHYSDRPPE